MPSAKLPRVNVVGLGKLGAPLAAVLASRGFDVIGLDVNKVLVDALDKLLYAWRGARDMSMPERSSS